MTKDDRKALFDAETPRIGIDLVTIIPDEGEPIYLCRNTEAITSRGHLYSPAQFEVTKPEKGSTAANGAFRISGVTQEQISLIQNLGADSEVLVEMAFVFADAPDDYLDGPYKFKLIGVSMESSVGALEMDLAAESAIDYFVSQGRYTSEDFPGIWT